jgi:hypothetical protein
MKSGQIAELRWPVRLQQQDNTAQDNRARLAGWARWRGVRGPKLGGFETSNFELRIAPFSHISRVTRHVSWTLADFFSILLSDRCLHDALTRPSFSDLFLARILGVAFLQPLAGNRTAGGNNAGCCAAHDPRLVIKRIHRVPSAKDLKDLPPKEGQED